MASESCRRMALSDQFLRLPGTRREFASTHWSMVLLAGSETTPQSAAALENLCRTYWYPLYSFTRRQGYGPPEAADLTQDFFTHIISSNALASVRREKGKFRSFLLASLKNLLTNEWNRANCGKRGGGIPLFSLDEDLAERRFQSETADVLSADKAFDRRWAETLLSRALERLRAECNGQEKSRRFDELKVFVTGENETTLANAAARLGMSLVAVKALVHRLRRRFGELIREDIAQTVSSREEVEEEIRLLFAAFTP